MSHFGSTAANFGTFRVLKTVIPAAALALSLSFASQGHATQYFLQSNSMDTSRTATITGPASYSASTYVAPIQFNAFIGTDASGAAFNFLGFCVDIFHHISLGTLNLKYDSNYSLTTDSKYLTTTPFSGGNALTAGQITQVGQLVNYGTQVFNLAPSSTDKTNRLAGLQGAIWQVVNPGYTVNSTAAVNSYISAYSGAGYASSLTGYGPVSSNITFITETGKYGTSAAHQSFAFASPNPEPGTWALLIMGFGMAGAALRRRTTLVPVTA